MPATLNDLSAAVATFSPRTPASGSQSLIDGPDGYPVINDEYAIVRPKQASASEAATVKAFLKNLPPGATRST